MIQQYVIWKGLSKIKAEFGLVSSRTTTYSVGINIPADSKRFSKLTFGSDFNEQSFAYTEVIKYSGASSGQVSNNYTSKYKEPTKDSYLYVTYQ